MRKLLKILLFSLLGCNLLAENLELKSFGLSESVDVDQFDQKLLSSGNIKQKQRDTNFYLNSSLVDDSPTSEVTLELHPDHVLLSSGNWASN